jgi:hypothetical protein
MLSATIIKLGDSGSWVTTGRGLFACGHVVCVDDFGDISIVPLESTFTDIKRLLGASAVNLPTHEDLLAWQNEKTMSWCAP